MKKHRIIHILNTKRMPMREDSAMAYCGVDFPALKPGSPGDCFSGNYNQRTHYFASVSSLEDATCPVCRMAAALDGRL